MKKNYLYAYVCLTFTFWVKENKIQCALCYLLYIHRHFMLQDQDSNAHMTYWLSNTSVLLFLLQWPLKATGGKPPTPTSFFGRITQVTKFLFTHLFIILSWFPFYGIAEKWLHYYNKWRFNWDFDHPFLLPTFLSAGLKCTRLRPNIQLCFSSSSSLLMWRRYME